MSQADARLHGALRGRGYRSLAAAAVVVLAVLACSKGPTGAVDSTATGSAVSTAQSRITAVAVASVLVTAAPESDVPPIDRVEISPASIVVDPGETIQLAARAYAADGTALPDVELVWTSPDPGAGTMSRAGRFKAGRKPGTYPSSISVTAIQNTPAGVQYASALSTVTVIGEARVSKLVSVQMIPDRPTVRRHQIFRIRAFGLDKDGLLIPGVGFAWKLSDPGLGRLNEIGLLTVEGDEGTYPRAVSVSAIWEGVEMTAVTDILVISAPEEDDYLNVHALPQRFFLEPGDRIRLRAVALNGLGRIESGTELLWGMVDKRAGTIDGTGNFIAGEIPGVYAEAVRVEAVVPGENGFVRAEDFASVVIRHRGVRQLHTVSVQPGTLVTAPGGRATLLVRTADASGDPADNVGLTWEVVKEAAGQVNEVVGFTAGDAPGIYEDALRVTAEQRLEDVIITRTDTVDVVVTGNLARSEVRPPLAVVAPGKRVHFSLTGWDGNDIMLPGLVVLWRVTDEKAGTLDALGNFRAGMVPGMYKDVIRAEIIQQLPDVR